MLRYSTYSYKISQQLGNQSGSVRSPNDPKDFQGSRIIELSEETVRTNVLSIPKKKQNFK